jgi:hypothetical protein
MSRLTSERGIALAVAIFALVVIGGLVAGSMFVATQEQRVGRNTLQQQAAFTAADAGNQDAIINWSTGGYGSLSVGGSVTTTATAPDGRGWYRRTVQKVGNLLFIVKTDGFNKDSTAAAHVGSLLKLKMLAFNINAALKTQGSAKIGGSSMISGVDSLPAGWTGCPALQPTLPGIRMPDPTLVQTSGCSPTGSPPDYPCIVGSPQDVQKDTTITSDSLTTVGDIPFDSLKQFASKIITTSNPSNPAPTLDVSGSCQTTDLYNWGDPLVPSAPCSSFFPIIWADQSISIQGGYGQGVLIVNGNLSVQGGFEFYGPVLIKGTLSTQGTGGHFNGGVIAANIDLSQSVVLGNAVINYSSCALIKALTSSATATSMRERSWVNLY